MRILKVILPVVLLTLFFFPVYSQAPESILDSVNAGRKPEKLFTHFDKEFYQPGETVWFKTYITVDGRPGLFSSVAKAELINDAGKVIASQIMPVVVGTASGSFLLPADLTYGTYVFRLFTQQMLNTGTDNYYYRIIPIIPFAGYFDKAAPVTDISLRFFAEGGTFLADELNILAFTAIDQQGKPVNITGTIKDRQGKDVASFATEQTGIGRTEITPLKGEQYSVHYILPSGTSRSLLLPAAETEGTNLLIVDEVLKKRLIVNSKFSDAKQKPEYIIGEMDQVVVFKIDISKSNGHFMGRVPVKDLPGGLLHVAVFNTDNKVLAERTCFVNSRRDTVSASLLPVTTSLVKRSENSFDFMLPDSLEGSFSVSVTDIAQTQSLIVNDNIIAATLVTSQLNILPGNIFNDIGQITGEGRNDALDLLLLTNEYKWNWLALEKLAKAKLPSTNENFIPLSGRAFSEKNKKSLPGTELVFILQTKDSSVNSFTAMTNENSYFEAPGLFYEDTATIFVKNNTDKSRDKKVEVEITSSTIHDMYNLPVQTAIITAQVPSFLKVNEPMKIRPAIGAQPVIDFDSSGGKILQELVVISKINTPAQLLEKRYTKGLFSGSARSTIDFINNKPSYLGGNIFDYLKGRYSYMQVRGTMPNYFLVYRNMFSLGSGQPIPMSLYLDEMVVDASVLISVPMNDIALVRIYGSGFLGTGGALAVYTKRGQDATGSSLFENMIKFSLPGFSKTNTFYSPDYKTLKKESIKRDNRRTLYWNPSLIFLPEDGKVPVSFYNNDQCKEYKIIVQGFSTDGKLVYLQKIIR